MEETKNREQQWNHLFSYLTKMEKLMKETKSDEMDTDGTQTGEWDEEAE